MQERLRDIAYNLNSNYWFIPAVMTASAILIGFLLLELNRVLPTAFLFERSYDATTAQQLVAIIAGSMITVVSIVFSITIVALTLTSQQYGPRMIENFLRDKGTQFVLGTFISVFAYCMVVLTGFQQQESGELVVPRLAVLLALVLSFLSICVLIYFIHHVAESIRGENIVAKVTRDMHHLTRSLYPSEIGHEPPEGFQPPTYMLDAGHQVVADVSGYLQDVYTDKLIAYAEDHKAVLQIERHPGEFILAGSPLVTVFAPNVPTAAMKAEINDLFDLGRARTVEQDLKLLFDKLVETALRALSPAINDPTTAMICLNRLAEGLQLLYHRPCPSRYRCDAVGNLRVIVSKVVEFEWMTDIAFTEIRRYARGDIAVLLHMLKLIAMLAGQVDTASGQYKLQEQAQLIMEQSAKSDAFLPSELAQIRQSYEETLAICRGRELLHPPAATFAG